MTSDSGPRNGRHGAPGVAATSLDNAMSPAELEQFLAEPHLGNLATIRPDGFPHVTPIWFVWAGRSVQFILGHTRLHLRNLRANPRAGISVASDDRIHEQRFAAGAQAAIAWGFVHIADGASALLQATYELQATKYLGASGRSDPDYLAECDAEERVLCVLHPVGRTAWDFRTTPVPASGT
jgi:PPOX class probable F420-dependent enzyme